MKQMRSRFRFIALVMVCAFLLTFAVCTGTALRMSGFSLSALNSIPAITTVSAPDPDVSAEPPSGESPAPVPSDAVNDEYPAPGTDNSPEPEYNIFGL